MFCLVSKIFKVCRLLAILARFFCLNLALRIISKHQPWSHDQGRTITVHATKVLTSSIQPRHFAGPTRILSFPPSPQMLRCQICGGRSSYLKESCGCIRQAGCESGLRAAVAKCLWNRQRKHRRRDRLKVRKVQRENHAQQKCCYVMTTM